MDNINSLGNDSSCSSGYADEIAIRNSSSRNNGNLILNIPEANKGLIATGAIGIGLIVACLLYLNHKINKLSVNTNENGDVNVKANIPYPQQYNRYPYYNPYENPVDPNTYIKK
jgi:hypothetical protein